MAYASGAARVALYAMSRAAISASTDNTVRAMPVAWIKRAVGLGADEQQRAVDSLHVRLNPVGPAAQCGARHEADEGQRQTRTTRRSREPSRR